MPTLLIPGLLCTPRLFFPQLPALWQRGPVTVADHRSHDDIRDLARSVLDAAPPTFDLVGLSMGGYIAFEIMRQQPERVRKLVLLDTTARPDSPERIATRHAQIAEARGGRFDAVVAASTELWVYRERALHPVVARMAHDTGVDGYARQQHAIMGRPDSRPGLAKISVPTLVLVGEQDTTTPPEHAEEIAQGVPGARLQVVPDCGHLATLEQPDEVTVALVAWLRR